MAKEFEVQKLFWKISIMILEIEYLKNVYGFLISLELLCTIVEVELARVSGTCAVK